MVVRGAYASSHAYFGDLGCELSGVGGGSCLEDAELHSLGRDGANGKPLGLRCALVQLSLSHRGTSIARRE